MPIQLLLVDDHAAVRQGLRLLLNQDSAIEVVGEAGDGFEALALVEALRPHVVLMDVLMPRMGGIEATLQIRTRFPETQVVALTGSSDDSAIVTMVRSGAIGYLTKNMQGLDLCRAVRGAAAGEVQLAADAARHLILELDPNQAAVAPTPRERQVLNLVAAGMSNLEISEQLAINERTVKSHVNQLLTKLNLRSRTQLAVHVWQGKNLGNSISERPR